MLTWNLLQLRPDQLPRQCNSMHSLQLSHGRMPVLHLQHGLYYLCGRILSHRRNRKHGMRPLFILVPGLLIKLSLFKLLNRLLPEHNHLHSLLLPLHLLQLNRNRLPLMLNRILPQRKHLRLMHPTNQLHQLLEFHRMHQLHLWILPVLRQLLFLLLRVPELQQH